MLSLLHLERGLHAQPFHANHETAVYRCAARIADGLRYSAGLMVSRR